MLINCIHALSIYCLVNVSESICLQRSKVTNITYEIVHVATENELYGVLLRWNVSNNI